MQMKRILIVFANPRGTDPLRLSTEDRAVRECVALSRNRDNLLLEFRHAATTHDVRRALLEQNYHLVHFSGHGTGKGLALENELGEMQIVPQTALAELLSAHSPPLECVILNACYTQEQGNLVSLHVPYTIAIGGPISDPAAIEFVRGFYDAIGAGKDIEFAYQEGCRAVKLVGLKEASAPVLLKSLQEEVREFFRACFPQFAQKSSTSLPSWLQGDCLKVFQAGIERARLSRFGQLTTRHILLALLELENGISAEAISHLGGNVERIAEGISNSIENAPGLLRRVEPTVSVRAIVQSLEDLCSNERLDRLDDGRILQVALEREPESVTIAELLSDLQCDKEQLLQAIVQVRAGRALTPRRKS